MQKLNLNHIPEAPENKDFWVVGTANREGSIDSNSYKKNLAKIGGNLEDMTSNITAEQKNLIRKNLGLYYEGTESGEKSVKFTFGEDTFVDSYAKISQDTPSKDDLVKIVNGSTEIIPGEPPCVIEDIEGGYDILPSENSAPYFRVITEGEGAGIYVRYGWETCELFYNGPVETVSKIDQKYLPEMESGGLPEITLLNMPTESGNITITDYLSTEDIATLDESGVAVAVLSGGAAVPGAKTNYVAVSQYIPLGGNPYSRTIAFYGPTGLKFIFKFLMTDWSVEMVPFIPVIKRSAAGTNLVMESIGFTTDVLNRIFSGEITRLKVPAGGDEKEIMTIARIMNAFGDWDIEMASSSKFITLIYRYRSEGDVGSIVTVYPES